MKILICIDDTDNRWSRGTGYKARKLGALLSSSNLATVKTISRHQLLVDKRIPYTSHNSSASLLVHSEKSLDDLQLFCGKFLKKESSFFSDAGLCIVPWDSVNADITEWGRMAKREILFYNDAKKLAEKNNIFLEGYSGKKTGIIGALAAAGLRRECCDGRVLWMNGLRELKGIFSASDLLNSLEIDNIALQNGEEIQTNAKILIREWCRPVHVKNKTILFVEKILNNDYEYQSASKEFIKSISE